MSEMNTEVQLRMGERMQGNELAINSEMIRDYCINQCMTWEEVKPIVNMAYYMLNGRGTAADYDNIALVVHYFKQQMQQERPRPIANTLLPSPLDGQIGATNDWGPDMQPLAPMPVVASTSVMDNIFHDAIDVQKILPVFPNLVSSKVDGIKRWFIIHRVLEEINWLNDCVDSHFIKWVDDHYGWKWSTRHFKKVIPEFKHSNTMTWEGDTAKDRMTCNAYKDFATKVRDCFVTINDGRVIDKECYFKRPDLFIYHPDDRLKK